MTQPQPVAGSEWTPAGYVTPYEPAGQPEADLWPSEEFGGRLWLGRGHWEESHTGNRRYVATEEEMAAAQALRQERQAFTEAREDREARQRRVETLLALWQADNPDASPESTQQAREYYESCNGLRRPEPAEEQS